MILVIGCACVCENERVCVGMCVCKYESECVGVRERKRA